ncbi:MAG: hypothetical protein H7Z43_06740 [Clostridia bacterium]|nr:hypothetical protein [Deltaproteobacteria bacterium]
MVSLALLDVRLAAQLRENPRRCEGVKVVAEAATLDALRSQAAAREAQVLVVSVEQLGNEPDVAVLELAKSFQAELTLITYYFAKREVIARFAGPQRRTLRGPISLDGLRAQLTSLLVRDKLASNGSAI